MKDVVSFLSIVLFFYLVLTWSVNNPNGAKKVKDDLDNTIKDTFESVAEYISSLDDKDDEGEKEEP